MLKNIRRETYKVHICIMKSTIKFYGSTPTTTTTTTTSTTSTTGSSPKTPGGQRVNPKPNPKAKNLLSLRLTRDFTVK